MSREVRDALLSVVRWVAENQQSESAFLYPDPMMFVERDGLLGAIEAAGVSKEETMREFNAVIDEKERRT